MEVSIIIDEPGPKPPPGAHIWILKAHAHINLIRNEDGQFAGTTPFAICIKDEDFPYCGLCGGDAKEVFGQPCTEEWKEDDDTWPSS